MPAEHKVTLNSRRRRNQMEFWYSCSCGAEDHLRHNKAGLAAGWAERHKEKNEP